MVLSVAASQEDGVAWRGIQYDLDAYGRVLSITREELAGAPAAAPAIEGMAEHATAQNVDDESTPGKAAKVTA